MIDINIIREQPETVINNMTIRGLDIRNQIETILETDRKRREIIKTLDDTLAEANQIAKEVGILFKSGQQEKAAELKMRSAVLKQTSTELDSQLKSLQEKQDELIVSLPNIPHKDTPKGLTPEDNLVVYSEGDIPKLHSKALPHWDLATKYNIIDFELGVKITGSGFPVYKGKGATLQRALINFFLSEGQKAGYLEIQPPLMVNETSAYSTGQLPDKDGQMYFIGLDNFYMIPTAEVPVTNIYRNDILSFDKLPVKNIAYSSCFRREAGSYGKDVRGLNRLHQFDKVEIVQIRLPHESYAALEEMREYVATLVRKLELPFRILRLCGGDLSFTSAWTYDFEVYSTAQQRWLEVSSVSNFETFQSNRMKLRYKDENGKTQLAHTLNGSALALPRIVAALLENHQTEEGIIIPEALVPYTGFDIIS